MKSMAYPDESDAVELDLALSIGGAFRNLPEKSTAACSEKLRRPEGKRKRNEDDERNPPLKRERKLQGNPAVGMPYPFSSLQFVPFLNGYAIPYPPPYWAASAAVVGGDGEKTLHQPVACRSFRRIGSCGSSPVCSSSVVSDNYQSSSSHEGVGSSNSSNSSSDRHRMPCPNSNLNSNPNSNDSMNHDKPETCREKFVEPNVSKIKEEPIMESNKDEVIVPSIKSVSNSFRSPSMSMKNMKMENGKPPKPQIHNQNVPSLKQMPCVTTTGVGPHGRTITGFLYRYSNLEVSIVCVCHGESFSPAEFVKHAGGGEISHPLRHITVLPSNGIPSAI